MGEAVSDESKLALLDILLDGVEELVLGYLEGVRRSAAIRIANGNCVGIEIPRA